MPTITFYPATRSEVLRRTSSKEKFQKLVTRMHWQGCQNTLL